MSVEQILQTAIEQQNALTLQAVEETRKLADRHYRLVGYTEKTIDDFHASEEKPTEEQVST